MSASHSATTESIDNVRWVLRPVNGGYKIERLTEDTDFRPPMWVHAGWLNRGRKFASRTEARDYMRSEVER